ncbi:amine sulfotransferase-like isoform 1-T2 [Discoglossus pictus]
MSQEAALEKVEQYLFKYKGVYFQTELVNPEEIDAVEHFEIKESDVFLVTYPKSGTIWTQQVLSLIFNEGHRNGTEAIDNMTRVPWIEYNLYKIDYKNRPSPRLFSSHLPYYLMPRDLRNRKGKVIYVSRNPKDAMVSFYHFYKIMAKMSIDIKWEEFFELYLSGLVLGGSYFDHIRGWLTHKEEYNFLFLTYEEMKKDLRSAVLKICQFVGNKLSDEEVETVVQKATFKNMKHDPLANYKFLPEDVLHKNKGDFLRKGTVGDWKNIMTVAQNEKFDKIYEEKMKDLSVNYVWDIHEIIQNQGN